MATMIINVTISPDMNDHDSPRNIKDLENRACEFIARYHGQVGDFLMKEADEDAPIPWVSGELEISTTILGRIRENDNSLRLEGLGVIIDFTISDKYANPDVCKYVGYHLTSCDEDGYCHFCGEQ